MAYGLEANIPAGSMGWAFEPLVGFRDEALENGGLGQSNLNSGGSRDMGWAIRR